MKFLPLPSQSLLVARAVFSNKYATHGIRNGTIVWGIYDDCKSITDSLSAIYIYGIAR
jgi:hypothetical protein